MVFDELLGLAQAVLCTEPDDFDVRMISSELLDRGSFPGADRSKRCPHPDQDGFLGRDQVAQVDLLAAAHVVDDEIRKKVCRYVGCRIECLASEIDPGECLLADLGRLACLGGCRVCGFFGRVTV